MFQLKCIWNICQAPGNGNGIRNPIPEADSKILDNGACPRSQELSSLSPKSQSPKPKVKTKRTLADTKITWATTHQPTHPFGGLDSRAASLQLKTRLDVP